MNGKYILERFGFQAKEEPVSIYPFSPVYHIQGENTDFIIKRTQNLQKYGNQVMHYIRVLREKGILVVTPVPLEVENPQLIDDVTYVVYPFIEGKKYSGTQEEIYEAGKLLGKIHALSPEKNAFDLEPYDVFDFDIEEVIESMEQIKAHAATNNLIIACGLLRQKFLEAVARQAELQTHGLPSVATPYDFKANNLVYTPAPFLIDPDNASWVPRIFDLALVLLLFHNEMATAPSRMFTAEEWQVFLDGYHVYVQLSEMEQAIWPAVLEHVFLDEVMWLMAESAEDWSDPSQQLLFLSLIDFLKDTSKYNLD
ncbi:phosphotransferase [Virgibacillus halophilus]